MMETWTRYVFAECDYSYYAASDLDDAESRLDSALRLIDMLDDGSMVWPVRDQATDGRDSSGDGSASVVIRAALRDLTERLQAGRHAIVERVAELKDSAALIVENIEFGTPVLRIRFKYNTKTIGLMRSLPSARFVPPQHGGPLWEVPTTHEVLKALADRFGEPVEVEDDGVALLLYLGKKNRSQWEGENPSYSRN